MKTFRLFFFSFVSSLILRIGFELDYNEFAGRGKLYVEL